MPTRKKPAGEELKEWCSIWDTTNKEGKLMLCERYGITYGTGKNWRSDAGVGSKNQVSVEDLLGMRPATNLDFVTFDLESSNLTADFSILLTAVIKPFGREPMVFRSDAYPEWATNRANDFKITRDVSTELRKHAVVIGHYSSKFDIPYLRAKMVKHGLEPLPPMWGIDSWRIAKQNFQVQSRRLKNLANFFDIGEKEGVEGPLWMSAAYDGDSKAMDKIVSHNIQDCVVLEKLAAISFAYLKSIPRL